MAQVNSIKCMTIVHHISLNTLRVFFENFSSTAQRVIIYVTPLAKVRCTNYSFTTKCSLRSKRALSYFKDIF